MEFKWSCEVESCDTNIHAFIRNATNESALKHLDKWHTQIVEHNDEHSAEVIWVRVVNDQHDPEQYGWYGGVPGVIALTSWALAVKSVDKKIQAIQQAGNLLKNCLRTDTATLRIVKGTDVDQLLREAIKYVLDNAFNECESRLFAAWKLLKGQEWALDVDAIYKD